MDTLNSKLHMPLKKSSQKHPPRLRPKKASISSKSKQIPRGFGRPSNLGFLDFIKQAFVNKEINTTAPPQAETPEGFNIMKIKANP